MPLKMGPTFSALECSTSRWLKTLKLPGAPWIARKAVHGRGAVEIPRLRAAPLLFRKQCLRKFPGIEWLQIVRLLADSNEFNRQPQFLLDCHDGAALACAIQLCYHQPGK